MSLRFLGGFCPRTGPGALPERAGWHRGALTLTRAPLRDCIIHGKALGEKKVGKKPTKRWGNVTVLAVTIQTQPHGPQGHLAARLSVSPGCGGGPGRGSPEGPRRGRRVLPGKAGEAAGAAGRAVGGRRRHRAGRARPVGLRCCPAWSRAAPGGAGNGEMEVLRRDCHGRRERAEPLLWVGVVFCWGRGQREEKN